MGEDKLDRMAQGQGERSLRGIGLNWDQNIDNWRAVGRQCEDMKSGLGGRNQNCKHRIQTRKVKVAGL